MWRNLNDDFETKNHRGFNRMYSLYVLYGICFICLICFMWYIIFYMVHHAFSEVVASLELFGEVVVQLAFDISSFITIMVHSTNRYAS